MSLKKGTEVLILDGNEVVRNYWSKWCSSNELERLELVKTLLFPWSKDTVLKHSEATMINSYLEDLEQFLNGGLK
jgi:hypothetical protein